MSDTAYCYYCLFEHDIDYHADFSFIMNHDVIAIIDKNKGNKSVTNDIEAVLFCIDNHYRDARAHYPENHSNRFKGLQNYSLIYKDSEGYWDWVFTNDEGKFKAFSCLHDEENNRITDINDAFMAASDQAIRL